MSQHSYYTIDRVISCILAWNISDVMVLSGYIQDENETEMLISSGPSDDYIGVVLVHNFVVMADLLVAIINYFGIQRTDIVEKLHMTWRALDRDGGTSSHHEDL